VTLICLAKLEMNVSKFCFCSKSTNSIKNGAIKWCCTGRTVKLYTAGEKQVIILIIVSSSTGLPVHSLGGKMTSAAIYLFGDQYLLPPKH
jgi:hypothetical protein